MSTQIRDLRARIVPSLTRFPLFFPRLSTPPFFNIYPVCCISVDYRRSVFSYTVHVFVCICTRLFFKKNCWDAVCACASWCQIDPNVRFHFKVACGQTNGYKVVHRRKGKSVHTCIMYVYVSNVLAVMDGWVVCVSPCSIAPTFLADLRMLSSATLAASGIRWAGPGCGRRGHVDRRPWSWSCHDRPTNFLVLPTFAMFSAH
jgi:hypothetical protein